MSFSCVMGEEEDILPNLFSDYMGPSCLYSLLSQRLRCKITKNSGKVSAPFLLKRNLTPSVRVSRDFGLYSERRDIYFSVKGQFPNSDYVELQKNIELLTLHILMKKVSYRSTNSSKDISTPYILLDSVHLKQFALNETTLAFHHRFKLPHDVFIDGDELYAVLSVSNKTSSAEQHIEWVKSLRTKLESGLFSLYGSEEVFLVCPNPVVIIDLSIQLHQYKRVKRNYNSRRHGIKINSRSLAPYGYPAGPSSDKALSVYLSKLLYNRASPSFSNIDMNKDRIHVQLTCTWHPGIAKENSNSKAICGHPLLRKIKGKQSAIDGSLVFHYKSSFVESSKPLTLFWHETKKYFNCPWCKTWGHSVPVLKSPVNANNESRPTGHSLKAFNLLMIHLKSFHYHFDYECGINQCGDFHVLLSRTFDNQKAEEVDQNELLQKDPICYYWRNDPERYLVNFYQASSDKDDPYSGSRGDNSFVAASKSLTINGRSGLSKFFHSATGQSMTMEELGFESDDEVSNIRTIQIQNKLIDEFADVISQEKELMRLWNSHIASFPTHGDRLLPLVCMRFVGKFADVIVRKNLRFCLLQHFMSMWDFGLLIQEEVLEYMSVIDKHASSLVSPDLS